MPKTSDRKNSKDCITVGGTTLTKQQLINRILSYEDKMDKDKLSYYKKKLNDNDCKTLYKMLIPPRESKSAKKPAAKKKPAAGKKPAGAVKQPAAKAKATANKTPTIAGAALESLPPGIAKQVVQMKDFMKWAKAAGSKPLNTRPGKKKAMVSDDDSSSDPGSADYTVMGGGSVTPFSF